VIAIADEGFDNGDADLVHPAFTGRIRRLHLLGNTQSAADTSGHGTHMCGSAAGNGQTSTQQHTRGIAAQATLVVQCAGSGYASIPGDCKKLFEPPYTNDEVVKA
jgi:serine protease AprX